MFSNLLHLAALALSLSSAATRASPLAPRQAPNTISAQYPNDMTWAINGTFFLLPVDKPLAESLAGGNKLLTPTGLPDGFIDPATQHVIILYTAYQSDIRMQQILKVDQINSVAVYVPFVDKLKDGSTPFIFGYNNFISDLLAGLVAALGGGYAQAPASFKPKNAAYENVGTQRSSVTSIGLDNPITGPGLVVDVFVTTNAPTSDAVPYPASTLQTILNEQAYVHRFNGLCNTEKWFFDTPFGEPVAVKGDVIASKPFVSRDVRFEGVYGYALVAEQAVPAGPGADCHHPAQPTKVGN